MNKNIRFIRQFLIAPKGEDVSLADFSMFEFCNYNVFAHNSLDVTFADNHEFGGKFCLIGYVVDFENISHGNLEILNGVAKARSANDIAVSLKKLSGRFVIFANFGEMYYVFHDACGLRTVYYQNCNNYFVIGSSTEIIRAVTRAERGMRYDLYMSSTYANENVEHYLPSGCSLYESVRHLVPNHYLDILVDRQVRYWPDTAISSLSPDEAAEAAANIITNSILALSKRAKLALPMTAGWDSRLLMALSKSIANELFLYTLKYGFVTDESADICIPHSMINRFGMTHNIIDCTIEPDDDDFKYIYESNSCPSHNVWRDIAFGIMKAYPSDMICMKGNCSEIVRCFYYPSGVHTPVEDHLRIVSLERGWGDLEFIVDEIANWFNSSNELCKSSNVDILDLFYWEHRMGGWQAQGQLEWDVAQEVFTPYSNRKLLEIMLSVPAQFRKRPDYLLYKKIIEESWPELLDYAINPAIVNPKK